MKGHNMIYKHQTTIQVQNCKNKKAKKDLEWKLGMCQEDNNPPKGQKTVHILQWVFSIVGKARIRDGLQLAPKKCVLVH